MTMCSCSTSTPASFWLDWLGMVVTPGATMHLRILFTDGAPSPFKLADRMLWLSKQGAPGCGTPRVRHIFRGTAHSKDDSYPELSHHKSAADRWQLRSVRPHCPHTHASSTVMLIAVLCLSHATGSGRGRPAFHSAGFLPMTLHLLRCARCKETFCARG